MQIKEQLKELTKVLEGIDNVFDVKDDVDDLERLLVVVKYILMQIKLNEELEQWNNEMMELRQFSSIIIIMLTRRKDYRNQNRFQDPYWRCC